VTAGAEHVRAYWDGNQNRFCFQGMSAGEARVTITGTFRKLIVGSALREEEVPFTHNVEVVVHPLRADARAIPVNYEIRAGQVRRAQLSVYLGPAFSRDRERNRRFRNVAVRSANPALADVRVTIDDRTGVLKLEIVGKQPGRVRLTLEGDQAVNRDWQHVVRTLDVEVKPQR
jgi:hypothetical protein